MLRANRDLSALKALPPCQTLYHVGGLRKPSTLYRSPSGFPVPGPGATPQPAPTPVPGTTPPAPTPGPGATPKSVPAPTGPGAMPPEAEERPEIGKTLGPSAPGFYVGFNAGGASGSSQWIEPDPSTNVFGVSGGLAGGTFGYAVQNGALLLGVEADIAGGGISGRTSVNCFMPCRTSNTFLATVRGRAGVDLGPVTPFVSGGLAVGDVNAHVGAFPGASTTRAGWAAGAGLQLPLTALAVGMPGGWVAKAEWLHVDLGSPHVCSLTTCGGNANVKFQTDLFRVGINIPLTALMPR